MNFKIVLTLLLAVFCLALTPVAKAQDAQDMMPAESSAKAKDLIQQMIAALGGPTYLNVHDTTCTGHLGDFGHSGDLDGFEHFIDYTQPPFKDRQENLPKRNIIAVFNGDKGWTLDRGGVTEAAASDVARFQEDTKIDLDNLLRHRIHEKDMVFRYGGQDIVELKEADWVELVDGDNRTIHLAIARDTHLPIEKIVDIRDPRTQLKSNETEYYSLYHPIDGVETPFQITRKRNGVKVFQVFFDKCEYNTGLSDALFTKESLDERWAKVGKKHKKHHESKSKSAKDKDNKDNKDTDDSSN
ncbi:MAG TPA: hypothetical protein VFW94_11760 [Candidatus Acidoferrales bacterium]|nr:hypothetical protein [Candidatus Acidoferrales bacterium]